MTQEDNFLRAIYQDPADDAVRLIYADWLEEDGRPERAEFIRLQCESARLPENDPSRLELEAREHWLLEHHAEEWLRPLRPWVRRGTFRRGFLAVIAASVRDYLEHRTLLEHLAPLARVEVDLIRESIPPAVYEFVPASVAHENLVIPIGWRGSVLVMAMQDPADWNLLVKLQFIQNRDIEPVRAQADQLADAIHRHYGEDVLTIEPIDCPPGVFLNPGPVLVDDLPVQADDLYVVLLVDLMIREALQRQATEIRIEPQADRFTVFYRTNGELVERDSPPRHLLEPVVARIQLLSAPTPGRIRGTHEDTSFDLGVSFLTTAHGPGVVLTF